AERVLGLGAGRAVPGDVNPPSFAQGDLPTADGPDRDRRAGLAVDPDWLGEALRAQLESSVEEVAAGRVSLKVNQVDDALIVDRRLGLNATIGRLDHPHAHAHTTGACPFIGPSRYSEPDRCRGAERKEG